MKQSSTSKNWQTLIKGVLKENRRLIVAGGVLFFVTLTICWFVLVPAYLNSNAKMYASGLGYPAMLKRLGKPVPVEIGEVTTERFQKALMGEGNCASDPILVPIVPMARVLEVYVEEGDQVTKGQLLCRLNDTKARVKYDSAKIAVSTATAELARVQVGSAYVLAQERPEMEKINLSAETERARLTTEKLGQYQSAYEKGVISRSALLDAESEYADAHQKLLEARLLMGMAEEGVVESKLIASNAVKDAKEALRHREAELKDYEVFSPVNGLVERILIKATEYNQDSGKPGFVLNSGLWFDAFFDQAEFDLVKKGLRAEVRLESYPGKVFPAIVERIMPVVNFNQGGPEISRPLRPRGTGAPEWAATFRCRLNFEEIPQEEAPIIMGMTGFARLLLERNSLAVPRSALVSISAGSGVVYIVKQTSDEKLEWKIREVRVGLVSPTHAEILEGVGEGEKIITDGHWLLKEGDEITFAEG